MRMMIPTRELIRLVQERRCLWDRAHPRYKDKLAKLAAWRQICKEFDADYDTHTSNKKRMIRQLFTRKWVNIRDRYAKTRKPGTQTRPYLYADQLRFLDSIYLSDNLKARTLELKRESIESELDADEGIDDATQHIFSENTVGDGNQNIDVKRPSCDNTGDCNIVSILTSLLDREEDEDRAFFKSITPAVKALSEKSKFEFRVQVLKLLNTRKAKNSTVKVKMESISAGGTDSE